MFKQTVILNHLSEMRAISDKHRTGENPRVKVLDFKDGQQFLGAASKNRTCGLGILRRLDGKCDIGFCDDGQFVDIGRINLKDGALFDGLLKGGKFHGRGVYYNPNDKSWFYGHFENGDCRKNSKQGKGKYPLQIVEQIRFQHHKKSNRYVDQIVATNIFNVPTGYNKNNKSKKDSQWQPQKIELMREKTFSHKKSPKLIRSLYIHEQIYKDQEDQIKRQNQRKRSEEKIRTASPNSKLYAHFLQKSQYSEQDENLIKIIPSGVKKDIEKSSPTKNQMYPNQLYSRGRKQSPYKQQTINSYQSPQKNGNYNIQQTSSPNSSTAQKKQGLFAGSSSTSTMKQTLQPLQSSKILPDANQNFINVQDSYDISINSDLPNQKEERQKRSMMNKKGEQKDNGSNNQFNVTDQQPALADNFRSPTFNQKGPEQKTLTEEEAKEYILTIQKHLHSKGNADTEKKSPNEKKFSNLESGNQNEDYSSSLQLTSQYLSNQYPVREQIELRNYDSSGNAFQGNNSQGQLNKPANHFRKNTFGEEIPDSLNSIPYNQQIQQNKYANQNYLSQQSPNIYSTLSEQPFHPEYQSNLNQQFSNQFQREQLQHSSSAYLINNQLDNTYNKTQQQFSNNLSYNRRPLSQSYHLGSSNVSDASQMGAQNIRQIENDDRSTHQQQSHGPSQYQSQISQEQNKQGQYPYFSGNQDISIQEEPLQKVVEQSIQSNNNDAFLHRYERVMNDDDPTTSYSGYQDIVGGRNDIILNKMQYFKKNFGDQGIQKRDELINFQTCIIGLQDQYISRHKRLSKSLNSKLTSTPLVGEGLNSSSIIRYQQDPLLFTHRANLDSQIINNNYNQISDTQNNNSPSIIRQSIETNQRLSQHQRNSSHPNLSSFHGENLSNQIFQQNAPLSGKSNQSHHTNTILQANNSSQNSLSNTPIQTNQLNVDTLHTVRGQPESGQFKDAQIYYQSSSQSLQNNQHSPIPNIEFRNDANIPSSSVRISQNQNISSYNKEREGSPQTPKKSILKEIDSPRKANSPKSVKFSQEIQRQQSNLPGNQSLQNNSQYFEQQQPDNSFSQSNSISQLQNTIPIVNQNSEQDQIANYPNYQHEKLNPQLQRVNQTHLQQQQSNSPQNIQNLTKNNLIRQAESFLTPSKEEIQQLDLKSQNYIQKLVDQRSQSPESQKILKKFSTLPINQRQDFIHKQIARQAESIFQNNFDNNTNDNTHQEQQQFNRNAQNLQYLQSRASSMSSDVNPSNNNNLISNFCFDQKPPIFPRETYSARASPKSAGEQHIIPNRSQSGENIGFSSYQNTSQMDIRQQNQYNNPSQRGQDFKNQIYDQNQQKQHFPQNEFINNQNQPINESGKTFSTFQGQIINAEQTQISSKANTQIFDPVYIRDQQKKGDNYSPIPQKQGNQSQLIQKIQTPDKQDFQIINPSSPIKQNNYGSNESAQYSQSNLNYSQSSEQNRLLTNEQQLITTSNNNSFRQITNPNNLSNIPLQTFQPFSAGQRVEQNYTNQNISDEKQNTSRKPSQNTFPIEISEDFHNINMTNFSGREQEKQSNFTPAFNEQGQYNNISDNNSHPIYQNNNNNEISEKQKSLLQGHSQQNLSYHKQSSPQKSVNKSQNDSNIPIQSQHNNDKNILQNEEIQSQAYQTVPDNYQLNQSLIQNKSEYIAPVQSIQVLDEFNKQQQRQDYNYESRNPITNQLSSSQFQKDGPTQFQEQVNLRKQSPQKIKSGVQEIQQSLNSIGRDISQQNIDEEFLDEEFNQEISQDNYNSKDKYQSEKQQGIECNVQNPFNQLVQDQQGQFQTTRSLSQLQNNLQSQSPLKKNIQQQYYVSQQGQQQDNTNLYSQSPYQKEILHQNESINYTLDDQKDNTSQKSNQLQRQYESNQLESKMSPNKSQQVNSNLSKQNETQSNLQGQQYTSHKESPRKDQISQQQHNIQNKTNDNIEYLNSSEIQSSRYQSTNQIERQLDRNLSQEERQLIIEQKQQQQQQQHLQNQSGDIYQGYYTNEKAIRQYSPEKGNKSFNQGFDALPQNITQGDVQSPQKGGLNQIYQDNQYQQDNSDEKISRNQMYQSREHIPITGQQISSPQNNKQLIHSSSKQNQYYSEPKSLQQISEIKSENKTYNNQEQQGYDPSLTRDIQNIGVTSHKISPIKQSEQQSQPQGQFLQNQYDPRNQEYKSDDNFEQAQQFVQQSEDLVQGFNQNSQTPLRPQSNRNFSPQQIGNQLEGKPQVFKQKSDDQQGSYQLTQSPFKYGNQESQSLQNQQANQIYSQKQINQPYSDQYYESDEIQRAISNQNSSYHQQQSPLGSQPSQYRQVTSSQQLQYSGSPSKISSKPIQQESSKHQQFKQQEEIYDIDSQRNLSRQQIGQQDSISERQISPKRQGIEKQQSEYQQQIEREQSKKYSPVQSLNQKNPDYFQQQKQQEQLNQILSQDNVEPERYSQNEQYISKSERLQEMNERETNYYQQNEILQTQQSKVNVNDISFKSPISEQKQIQHTDHTQSQYNFTQQSPIQQSFNPSLQKFLSPGYVQGESQNVINQIGTPQTVNQIKQNTTQYNQEEQMLMISKNPHNQQSNQLQVQSRSQRDLFYKEGTNQTNDNKYYSLQENSQLPHSQYSQEQLKEFNQDSAQNQQFENSQSQYQSDSKRQQEIYNQNNPNFKSTSYEQPYSVSQSPINNPIKEQYFDKQNNQQNLSQQELEPSFRQSDQQFKSLRQTNNIQNQNQQNQFVHQQNSANNMSPNKYQSQPQNYSQHQISIIDPIYQNEQNLSQIQQLTNLRDQMSDNNKLYHQISPVNQERYLQTLQNSQNDIGQIDKQYPDYEVQQSIDQQQSPIKDQRVFKNQDQSPIQYNQQINEQQISQSNPHLIKLQSPYSQVQTSPNQLISQKIPISQNSQQEISSDQISKQNQAYQQNLPSSQRIHQDMFIDQQSPEKQYSQQQQIYNSQKDLTSPNSQRVYEEILIDQQSPQKYSIQQQQIMHQQKDLYSPNISQSKISQQAIESKPSYDPINKSKSQQDKNDSPNISSKLQSSNEQNSEYNQRIQNNYPIDKNSYQKSYENMSPVSHLSFQQKDQSFSNQTQLKNDQDLIQDIHNHPESTYLNQSQERYISQTKLSPDKRKNEYPISEYQSINQQQIQSPIQKLDVSVQQQVFSPQRLQKSPIKSQDQYSSQLIDNTSNPLYRSLDKNSPLKQEQIKYQYEQTSPFTNRGTYENDKYKQENLTTQATAKYKKEDDQTSYNKQSESRNLHKSLESFQQSQQISPYHSQIIHQSESYSPYQKGPQYQQRGIVPQQTDILQQQSHRSGSNLRKSQSPSYTPRSQNIAQKFDPSIEANASRYIPDKEYQSITIRNDVEPFPLQQSIKKHQEEFIKSPNLKNYKKIGSLQSPSQSPHRSPHLRSSFTPKNLNQMSQPLSARTYQEQQYSASSNIYSQFNKGNQQERNIQLSGDIYNPGLVANPFINLQSPIELITGLSTNLDLAKSSLPIGGSQQTLNPIKQRSGSSSLYAPGNQISSTIPQVHQSNNSSNSDSKIPFLPARGSFSQSYSSNIYGAQRANTPQNMSPIGKGSKPGSERKIGFDQYANTQRNQYNQQFTSSQSKTPVVNDPTVSPIRYGRSSPHYHQTLSPSESRHSKQIIQQNLQNLRQSSGNQGQNTNVEQQDQFKQSGINQSSPNQRGNASYQALNFSQQARKSSESNIKSILPRQGFSSPVSTSRRQSFKSNEKPQNDSNSKSFTSSFNNQSSFQQGILPNDQRRYSTTYKDYYNVPTISYKNSQDESKQIQLSQKKFSNPILQTEETPRPSMQNLPQYLQSPRYIQQNPNLQLQSSQIKQFNSDASLGSARRYSQGNTSQLNNSQNQQLVIPPYATEVDNSNKVSQNVRQNTQNPPQYQQSPRYSSQNLNSQRQTNQIKQLNSDASLGSARRYSQGNMTQNNNSQNQQQVNPPYATDTDSISRSSQKPPPKDNQQSYQQQSQISSRKKNNSISELKQQANEYKSSQYPAQESYTNIYNQQNPPVSIMTTKSRISPNTSQLFTNIVKSIQDVNSDFQYGHQQNLFSQNPSFQPILSPNISSQGNINQPRNMHTANISSQTLGPISPLFYEQQADKHSDLNTYSKKSTISQQQNSSPISKNQDKYDRNNQQRINSKNQIESYSQQPINKNYSPIESQKESNQIQQSDTDYLHFTEQRQQKKGQIEQNKQNIDSQSQQDTNMQSKNQEVFLFNRQQDRESLENNKNSKPNKNDKYQVISQQNKEEEQQYSQNFRENQYFSTSDTKDQHIQNQVDNKKYKNQDHQQQETFLQQIDQKNKSSPQIPSSSSQYKGFYIPKKSEIQVDDTLNEKSAEQLSRFSQDEVFNYSSGKNISPNLRETEKQSFLASNEGQNQFIDPYNQERLLKQQKFNEDGNKNINQAQQQQQIAFQQIDSKNKSSPQIPSSSSQYKGFYIPKTSEIQVDDALNEKSAEQLSKFSQDEVFNYSSGKNISPNLRGAEKESFLTQKEGQNTIINPQNQERLLSQSKPNYDNNKNINQYQQQQQINFSQIDTKNQSSPQIPSSSSQYKGFYIPKKSEIQVDDTLNEKSAEQLSRFSQDEVFNYSSGKNISPNLRETEKQSFLASNEGQNQFIDPYNQERLLKQQRFNEDNNMNIIQEQQQQQIAFQQIDSKNKSSPQIPSSSSQYKGFYIPKTSEIQVDDALNEKSAEQLSKFSQDEVFNYSSGKNISPNLRGAEKESFLTQKEGQNTIINPQNQERLLSQSKPNQDNNKNINQYQQQQQINFSQIDTKNQSSPQIPSSSSQYKGFYIPKKSEIQVDDTLNEKSAEQLSRFSQDEVFNYSSGKNISPDLREAEKQSFKPLNEAQNQYSSQKQERLPNQQKSNEQFNFVPSKEDQDQNYISKQNDIAKNKIQTNISNDQLLHQNQNLDVQQLDCQGQNQINDNKNNLLLNSSINRDNYHLNMSAQAIVSSPEKYQQNNKIVKGQSQGFVGDNKLQYQSDSSQLLNITLGKLPTSTQQLTTERDPISYYSQPDSNRNRINISPEQKQYSISQNFNQSFQADMNQPETSIFNKSAHSQFGDQQNKSLSQVYSSIERKDFLPNSYQQQQSYSQNLSSPINQLQKINIPSNQQLNQSYLSSQNFEQNIKEEKYHSLISRDDKIAEQKNDQKLQQILQNKGYQQHLSVDQSQQQMGQYSIPETYQRQSLDIKQRYLSPEKNSEVKFDEESFGIKNTQNTYSPQKNQTKLNKSNDGDQRIQQIVENKNIQLDKNNKLNQISGLIPLNSADAKNKEKFDPSYQYQSMKSSNQNPLNNDQQSVKVNNPDFDQIWDPTKQTKQMYNPQQNSTQNIPIFNNIQQRSQSPQQSNKYNFPDQFQSKQFLSTTKEIKKGIISEENKVQIEPVQQFEDRKQQQQQLNHHFSKFPQSNIGSSQENRSASQGGVAYNISFENRSLIQQNPLDDSYRTISQAGTKDPQSSSLFNPQISNTKDSSSNKKIIGSNISQQSYSQNNASNYQNIQSPVDYSSSSQNVNQNSFITKPNKNIQLFQKVSEFPSQQQNSSYLLSGNDQKLLDQQYQQIQHNPKKQDSLSSQKARDLSTEFKQHGDDIQKYRNNTQTTQYVSPPPKSLQQQYHHEVSAYNSLNNEDEVNYRTIVSHASVGGQIFSGQKQYQSQKLGDVSQNQSFNDSIGKINSHQNNTSFGKRQNNESFNQPNPIRDRIDNIKTIENKIKLLSQSIMTAVNESQQQIRPEQQYDSIKDEGQELYNYESYQFNSSNQDKNDPSKKSMNKNQSNKKDPNNQISKNSRYNQNNEELSHFEEGKRSQHISPISQKNYASQEYSTAQLPNVYSQSNVSPLKLPFEQNYISVHPKSSSIAQSQVYVKQQLGQSSFIPANDQRSYSVPHQVNLLHSQITQPANIQQYQRYNAQIQQQPLIQSQYISSPIKLQQSVSASPYRQPVQLRNSIQQQQQIHQQYIQGQIALPHYPQQTGQQPLIVQHINTPYSNHQKSSLSPIKSSSYSSSQQSSTPIKPVKKEIIYKTHSPIIIQDHQSRSASANRIATEVLNQSSQIYISQQGISPARNVIYDSAVLRKSKALQMSQTIVSPNQGPVKTVLISPVRDNSMYQSIALSKTSPNINPLTQSIGLSPQVSKTPIEYIKFYTPQKKQMFRSERLHTASPEIRGQGEIDRIRDKNKCQGFFSCCKNEQTDEGEIQVDPTRQNLLTLQQIKNQQIQQNQANEENSNCTIF